MKLPSQIPPYIRLRDKGDTLVLTYQEPRAKVWGLLFFGFALWASLIVMNPIGSRGILPGLAIIFCGVGGLMVVLLGMSMLPVIARIKFSRPPTQPSSVPFRGEATNFKPSTIELHQRNVYVTREVAQDVVLLERLHQVRCVSETLSGERAAVYHVEAILRDGKVVTLVKDIHDLKTAQYIEAKIESFLQIEDEPVAVKET